MLPLMCPCVKCLSYTKNKILTFPLLIHTTSISSTSMYPLSAFVNVSFLLQFCNCSLNNTKVLKVMTLFKHGKVGERHHKVQVSGLRIQSRWMTYIYI